MRTVIAFGKKEQLQRGLGPLPLAPFGRSAGDDNLFFNDALQEYGPCQSE